MTDFPRDLDETDAQYYRQRFVVLRNVITSQTVTVRADAYEVILRLQIVGYEVAATQNIDEEQS